MSYSVEPRQPSQPYSQLYAKSAQLSDTWSVPSRSSLHSAGLLQKSCDFKLFLLPSALQLTKSLALYTRSPDLGYHFGDHRRGSVRARFRKLNLLALVKRSPAPSSAFRVPCIKNFLLLATTLSWTIYHQAHSLASVLMTRLKPSCLKMQTLHLDITPDW